MSCKVCDFFKEANRTALFWISITRLNDKKMESRYLVREELNYCPSCGIELRTLREDSNEAD